MGKMINEKIGKYIDIITDYHANGSYETLKSNVSLLQQRDYAIMIRTLNFERDDFYDDLLFINKHAYDFLEKSKAFPNDILMNKIANPGSIYILPDLNYPVSCGMNLFLIRFNTVVNQRYMYYCMKNSEPYIKSLAHGTTTKTITKDDVRNIQLLIHENIQDQNNISVVLSLIDMKIELNKKIIAELESMAKTIYDYWFVQFDFPNAEGKPYRSSGGDMVWCKMLKREIPKGWDDTTLSHFIGQEKGGDWGEDKKTGNYTEQVVCIRGADFPGLKGKQSLNAPLRYILKKNSYKVLCSGDIIVEISGGSPTQSTGRVCFINSETIKRFKLPLITSNFCKAFSLKKPESQYWFYILWEKLYDAGVFFKYEGKTTGIKNLLFDFVCEDYRVVCPADIVINNFNGIVSPIFEKIQKTNLENDELTNLRDWLLPMLMNGQVTVK